MFQRRNVNNLQDAKLNLAVDKPTKTAHRGLQLALRYIIKTACEIIKASYWLNHQDDQAEEMDKFFSVAIFFFLYKCRGFNNMKNTVWTSSSNKTHRKDKHTKAEESNERNNRFLNRARTIYYIWFQRILYIKRCTCVQFNSLQRTYRWRGKQYDVSWKNDKMFVISIREYVYCVQLVNKLEMFLLNYFLRIF